MRVRSTRVAWGVLAVFAVGYLAVPLSFANGNVQREPGFYLALCWRSRPSWWWGR
jgi:hypothetical protein